MSTITLAALWNVATYDARVQHIARPLTDTSDRCPHCGAEGRWILVLALDGRTPLAATRDCGGCAKR